MSDLARTSIEFTVLGTAAASVVLGVVLGFWLADFLPTLPNTQGKA